MGCSSRAPNGEKPPAQELHVYIKLSDDAFGTFEEREAVYALEDRLCEAVDRAGVGEWDGHEFGGGYCIFFFGGPRSEELRQALAPLLREAALPEGSYLLMIAEEPEEREERVDL